MGKEIVIIGGHGEVAQHLTRILLTPDPSSPLPAYSVTSIIRSSSQAPAILALGARPVVLSVEDTTVDAWRPLLRSADVVFYGASAGRAKGDDREERLRRTDYEGAKTVFDAVGQIEEGQKPRVVVLGAVDVRDPEKLPEYYDEQDKQISARVRQALGPYMHFRLLADRDLMARPVLSVPWTILRLGGLSSNPPTGQAVFGKTHISTTISREDVAKALALLADPECTEAVGLAVDIVGGKEGEEGRGDIEEGLEKAVKEKAGWTLEEIS